MLTVCNRISLDSIWHIQLYCLGVDIYSCIVIAIAYIGGGGLHCFDNSDMTPPNSLIFSYSHARIPATYPGCKAFEWVKLILFF